MAQWNEAIKSEIDSTLQKPTWELVSLLSGCKPLGYKWIFKKKMKVDGTIDKYKARLVIKGFKQYEGLDFFDTYLPVTRITSIRMVLAIVALRKLKVYQMDMKMTFLNGELENVLYMNQREDFMAPGLESKVCRLVKSLYDSRKALKQGHQFSPYHWDRRGFDTVVSVGFAVAPASLLLGVLYIATASSCLYYCGHCVPDMPVVRFYCPFVGLSGCHDGGVNGLTKTSLITHLCDRHCSGEAQVITKHSILSDLAVFERAGLTLKRMGLWLCGVCFRMHTLRSKCRHGFDSDFVSPPDGGDGVVRFVLYDLTKPQVSPCSKQVDHVNDGVSDLHGGFTLALLDSLFSKGLRTVKSIPPKCRLGFSRVLKGALDKVICKPDDISCWVSLLALPLCLLKTFRPRSNLECKSAIKRQRQEECIVNAIRSWGTPGGSFQLLRETLAESSPTFLDVDDDDLDLGERNIKQCKRKICDGHYSAAVGVLSSSGVALYSEATLEELKTKHPFHPAPSLPHVPNDLHHLIAS
ncbi:putative reverse transcriptase domain-containing protein [Tanacetum coccineum]